MNASKSNNTLLDVPDPPKLDFSKIFLGKIVFLTVLNTLGVPALVYLYVTQRSTVSDLFRLARQPSIDTQEHNKDLEQKALSLASSQVYLKTNALEYQISEGYCSLATERCILKSIPSFPRDDLPAADARGGPSTADKFADTLHQNDEHCKSTVVYGSEGYTSFVQALRKSNDCSYRVVVNFLRSSLFGFMKPNFLPSSLLLGLIGGHFSPVLGFLEDENLVAIFDVNHKYGFYLCNTKRLFDAVNTIDIMTGNTRGLIVTEVTTGKKDE